MVISSTRSWLRGDVDPVSPLTLRPHRIVLAVVHSFPAGDRLSEFVRPLLEVDQRVQVIWTLAPDALLERSGHEFMRSLDATVLPWEEAIGFRYDLALAANHGHLERVRAPVLILPHGTGMSRRLRRGPGHGPPVERPVGGMIPGALVRYGRLVPSALGVANEAQGAQVTRALPEAEQVVTLLGDPAYDRALAALPERERFRRAMGVTERQRLVVVSSSWGPAGVWGTRPDLIDRLMAELPRGHVAALILHPGIWWVHGPRQVLAWSTRARRRGLRVLAPTSPWLGSLVAADVMIGDGGSVTAYGAGLGAPTLLAGGGLAEVQPGSTPDLLHRIARHHRDDVPLGRQIEETVEHWRPEFSKAIHARLTSVPGRSAALLRATMYRLMDLTEPGEPARLEALRGPEFVGTHLSNVRERAE